MNKHYQLTIKAIKNYGLSEVFQYDALDRLTNDSLVATTVKHSTAYASNGNISTTTWGGTYKYGSSD